MPFISSHTPLISKAERSLILDSTDIVKRPVPDIWRKIWNHLYLESRRCVSDCSRGRLARIALQMQEIGVAIDLDGSGFNVFFAEQADASRGHPWGPGKDEVIQLPPLASLIDPAAGKSKVHIINEISTFAGLDDEQLQHFWFEGHPDERMLDILMKNDYVAAEVRQRLLEAHDSDYLVHLDVGAHTIYCEMSLRLEANEWVEHAIARAKRKL